MRKGQREQKVREILDFRYSIIAELLNPYLCRTERRKLIREKAKREYEIPHSNKRSISGDCINKWYRKFKDFGKEALAPKSRSDIGVSRVLASEEAAALTEYLDVNPELTARAAYKKLREEGVITKELSSSSLSRLICAAGLDRESREKRGDERQQLKFAFLHPLECVQADIMHGFPVPDEKGKLKKTYLLVILDDTSRMIVYGNFCRRESSIEFEYGIKHVLLSRGRIGRVFCDNGAPFVSGQTLRILSILVFCPSITLN